MKLCIEQKILDQARLAWAQTLADLDDARYDLGDREGVSRYELELWRFDKALDEAKSPWLASAWSCVKRTTSSFVSTVRMWFRAGSGI